MLTQRYSIDESAYDIFTFNGDSINPMNKRKAFRINLGNNFGLHGVGDFANYSMQRVENMTGHTQSFSGAIDHMFTGCVNFKFSSVLANLNMNTITSMLGFMSGCSSYVEHFKLNNATGSTLTDLTGCFEYSAYKAVNIKNWDVSEVTSVESFLEGTTYNRAGISENWNTSNVTNFKNMFKNNADFKQYLGGIDVSSAQSMEGMFHNAKEYNGYSAQWDVTNVGSFKNMFRGASSFNKPIGKWKTGSATTMKGMFCNASSFDQALWAKPGTERWDTSNAENLESMFEGSAFSESTNSWNIGKVKSFKNMFKSNKAFNKQLPLWGSQFGQNLTENEKSIDFTGMFESSVFNQPVKGWNVSGATSVKNMFKDNTEFNSQLFPGWKLKGTKCENVTNFLCGTTALSTAVNSASTADSIKDALKTYGNTLKNSIGFPLIFCANDTAIPDELKSDVYESYRATWESENLVSEDGQDAPEELPNESTDPCVNSVFDGWISFDAPTVTINEDGSAGRMDLGSFTADSDEAPHSCVDAGTMYVFIVKRGYESNSLATDILYNTTSFNSNVYGYSRSVLKYTSDNSSAAGSFFNHSTDSTCWTNVDISSADVYSDYGWTVNSSVTESFSSWLGSDDIDIIFQSVGIDFTADIPEVVMFNDAVQADTVQLSSSGFSTKAQLRAAVIDWYEECSASSTNAANLAGNSLEYGPIGDWDVSAITDFSELFDMESHQTANSRFIAFVDLSNWDVSNGTNFYAMFKDFRGRGGIDISGWDLGKATNCGSMFAGIPFAQYIKGLSALGSTFTSEITNLSYMLKDIRSAYGDYYDTESSSIVEFDLSSWNVGSVTDMSNMFNGSTNSVNGNGLITTSRVTSFGDLSSWDVSNVTDMDQMFGFLPNLEQPGDLSSWCVSQIASAPLDFAKNATWETDTSKQPNWGASC
jgi:surface protein